MPDGECLVPHSQHEAEARAVGTTVPTPGAHGGSGHGAQGPAASPPEALPDFPSTPQPRGLTRR